MLVEGSLPTLDRDLVDAAGAAGCPVVAVDDRRGPRDWSALGVAGVLPDFFDPKALVDTLAAHSAPIERGDAVPTGAVEGPAIGRRGLVAVVCGPGGTGASTAAMALAQGLGSGPRHGGAVLLADLALHAEQAMLHDAHDVVPGIQELVEAHRSRSPSPEEVRGLTFHVPDRGYRLLLGLRNARAWSTIRPRAFAAAFDVLCSTFGVVVCDTDPDLEGEEEGGSIEVEERHLMARAAASRADVVFAVGVAGMKGLHSLVRVLAELEAFGVPPSRVVPVLNRAPKSPSARAEMAGALAALARAGGNAALPSPVFLPDRRVEEALRQGQRLPTAITEPLAGAFAAVTDRGGRGVADAGEGKLVRPGTLGSWTDDDASEGAAFG